MTDNDNITTNQSSGIEPFSSGLDIYVRAFEAQVSESLDKNKYIAGLIVALLVSVALNFTQFNYLPDAKVVAQTPDGRLMPLPTLDEPYFNDTYYIEYARRKALKLYSATWTDLGTYKTRVSQFMVESAADDFMSGMSTAGIFTKIQEERRIMRSIVTRPPQILDKYVVDGRFVVAVQLPITVVFEGAEDKDVEHWTLTLNIGREHLMTNSEGLVVGSVQVGLGRNMLQ